MHGSAPMNPFVLLRADLPLAVQPERVLVAVGELLRDGFDDSGRHHRLFGHRLGSTFSLSLGMPVLGGGLPVLRGRVMTTGSGTNIDISVGARYEAMAFVTFWLLVTVLGGGYQIVLQIQRVLAKQAAWSAVGEVLPGIGIMAALLFGGLWGWRRHRMSAAYGLLNLLGRHLGALDPARTAAATLPPPIH